jgi:hypothetical protein
MNQIQTLKLEPTDDITAIRSRIELATTSSTPTDVQPQRLLLVVPRKNKALQSLVNMKLLARAAKSRAIELAMVSDDPIVRDFAKAAGLKTFGSMTSASWGGWAVGPVAAPAATTPPVAAGVTIPAGPVKRVKNKKYRVIRGSGRPNIWQILGMLVLLVILAATVVIATLALLPQATVTLIPVAKPLQTDLVVHADPSAEGVDFATLTFPARTAQVELALSGEIETVETELSPVGLATGAVTFINRTDQPQLVPISTTVTTSAGEPIQFTTQITTEVPPGPGATSPAIPIQAVEPGPDGNVGPGQINRVDDPSLGLGVRVINEQGLGGGTLEPARVVVQDDKDRLQAYLRQQIQQEGLKQLQDSLDEQEFISPETVQVIVLDVKYREFAGDVSDVFGGQMQAVVRGTVVGGYNANRLALAALQAQVPPGYELDTKGLHFGAGEVLDIQDQTVTFRILAAGQAVPVIDKHEVAKNVAWRSIGEAQQLLNQQYDLATVPGVELEPTWLVEWLGRLPFSPFRIEVMINEAVTLVANGDK